MKRLLVVTLLTLSCGALLNEEEEASPPGNGGAAFGGGRSPRDGGGDGGGRGEPDAGQDAGFADAGPAPGNGDGFGAGVEGDPCTAAPDCGPGLFCALQMTSTNTVFRCSVCASEGQPCGAGGSCLTVFTANRPTLVCSAGQPGEPCRTGADCRSNDCVASVSGGSDRSTCR